MQSFDGKHRVDIRNIRSPIVVFASWGDNITPPQQALNWIPDLYRSVEEIRANGQTIVYCLHEKIGHLGIFVSASIAKSETSELTSALELIERCRRACTRRSSTDTTPDMPGLEPCRAATSSSSTRARSRTSSSSTTAASDERAFEIVNRVSQINQGLYDTFASPVVKAMSNEGDGAPRARPQPGAHGALGLLGPQSWMWWVRATAEWVRENRQPVAADNPLVQAEKKMSEQIEDALDRYRDVRDDLVGAHVQGTVRVALARGRGRHEGGRRERAGPAEATWEHEELKRLKLEEIESQIESGPLVDAWARLLLYVGREDKVGDERPFNLLRRMIEETQARERALARRPQGGAQAPGVRAGPARGTRDRRAAEARARHAAPAPRLRGGARRGARARRADAAPGRAPAPRRRASWESTITGAGAEIRMNHEKYRRLIDAAKALQPVPTAVAHPCDQSSLAGRGGRGQARPDPRRSWSDPRRRSTRCRRAQARHRGLRAGRCAAQPRRRGEGGRAGAQGKAEALMKGGLHTDELMGEVVKRDTGLRTARRISHCFVMDVPVHADALIITDAAVNIAPTLEDKVDIVQNAIDLAHALRFPEVRVAILSAMETVNPDVPSTVEAAALCKMADRGQITGGILDGPLALDNAISPEAAEIKRIVSPVAGRANVLIVPDLEAGNMLAKSLSFLAGADAAGMVLGARVPVILTSRADSVMARLASCAVAALVAQARRERRQGGRRLRRMTDAILVLNAGSSSIKFSRLRRRGRPGSSCAARAYRGDRAARRCSSPRTRRRSSTRDAGRGDDPATRARSNTWSAWLREQRGDTGSRRSAIGWCTAAPTTRSRSGSSGCSRSSRRSSRSRRCISRTISRRSGAPRAAAGLPQVACFDTAFHRASAPVAQMFALPRDHRAGVRRYGFHGLSYEYIALGLPELDARAAARAKSWSRIWGTAPACAPSTAAAASRARWGSPPSMG